MNQFFNFFKRNIKKWFIILFCAYWLFIVFFNFISSSSDYVFAFRFFKYWDFLITAYLTGLLLSLFFIRKPFKWHSITISGFRNVYFYPILLIFMTMMMWFFFFKISLDFSVFQYILKTILIHSSLIIVFAASISAGSFLLKKINPPSSFKSNIFLQISLGFTIMSFGIFILGIINQFNWYTASIWLLVLTLSGWGGLVISIKNKLWKKQPDISLKPFSIFLIITVIIIISINLITVTSPFPIGFDSLTLYMNIPKLISNYGGLIEGLHPYNWSLIVSIGYVIFGSNAVALHLGSVSSILLIFLIFKISRSFVSTDWALFSAILFYTLPLVVWPSSIEIKTDLGMFFIMLTVLHTLFDFYYSKQKFDSTNLPNKIFDNEAKIWMIAGVLTGFSIGIKFTSLIAIIGIVVFLFYYYYGKFATIASLLVFIALIFIFNLHTYPDLSFSKIEMVSFSSILVIIACAFIFLAKRKGMISTYKPVKLIFILVISAGITFLPWGFKNTVESVPPNLSGIIKTSESISAKFNIDLKYFGQHELFKPILTQVLNNKNDEVANVNENTLKTLTAKNEEIKRYLGYEGGFMRFLSLPYDLTNKVNVDLFSTDISYLFLAFIPLILFGQKQTRILPFLIRLVFLIICFSLSFWSAHNPDNLLSINELQNIFLNKYYGFSPQFSDVFSFVFTALIYPFLLIGNFLAPLYNFLSFDNDLISITGIIIFSALCYFLFKDVLLDKLDLKSKSLLVFVSTCFIFWLILSSGIPWYGIVGFGLLPLVLAKFYFTSQISIFQHSRFIKGLSLSFIFIWLFILLLFRISPLFMGKTSNPELINYSNIFSTSSALYASNQMNEKRAFNTAINVETRKIIQELNVNKDTKILNVASLLTFFIEENDKRVYNDNQLDYFSTLWNESEFNKITTTFRLKEKGFSFILVDLESHTLDFTPEKSLLKKVLELFDYLKDNPYVELVYTDRLVQHPQGDRQVIIDGNIINVKYDVFGVNVVEMGKTALFKINF